MEPALPELVAHRIYALALPDKNLNDHEELCRDPPLGFPASKGAIEEHSAGKSTLNRWGLAPAGEPHDGHFHNIT